MSSTWETIGFVRGKGTTTVPQSYSFIDSDITSGTWFYRLQQQDIDGKIYHSEIMEVNLTIPTKFALYQNYPNPFNSSTIIKYELPVGEHQVRLIIYDLLGHQIRMLVEEENQQAGAYQISWDGRDDDGNAAASGVYFYRLQAGRQSFIKKLVLIE
jgi:flagellar hook assembly protein FlgD